MNRAVYDTALAIIESMIEASFVMPSGVEDAGEALEGDAFIDFVAPKVSVTQWFHLNPKTCDVFRAGMPEETTPHYVPPKEPSDSNGSNSKNKKDKPPRIYKLNQEDYELQALDDDDLFRMMVALDRHRCIQWCQPKLSGSIRKMYGLSNLLVNQEGAASSA